MTHAVTRPAPTQHSPEPTTPAPAVPAPPLQPRPTLFKVLCAAFALWVGFLVVLYFKTVYPGRSTAPRPDAAGMIRPDATTSPAP